MIDEDLDRILERMALDQGTSKAALIRRFVRERVAPLPPIGEDPTRSGDRYTLTDVADTL